MLRYTLAEQLKMKRTFALKLTWIMPLLTMLISFLLMGGRYFQIGAYNWWYIILLPGSLTLFCTLVMSKDAKMKFRGILALPADLRKIWLGKVMLCTGWLFIVCMLFFAGVALGGVFLGQTIAPADGFLGSLLLTVTMAWQIPLCLFLAARVGLFITLLINLAGNVGLGIMFANKASWWLIPYSIPVRLMSPALKILPNGLPAEAGNPLLDKGVILPGILIALMLCGILLWLTALWFKKREAK